MCLIVIYLFIVKNKYQLNIPINLCIIHVGKSLSLHLSQSTCRQKLLSCASYSLEWYDWTYVFYVVFLKTHPCILFINMIWGRCDMSFSHYQVVIVPIWKTADEKTGVLNAVSSVEKILKTTGFRVKVDDSEQRTPGWKFNFWEMKVCT